MQNEVRTHPETNKPDHTTTDRARTGHGGRAAPALARLDELDDYKVADGYPDPRGWAVKARDGRKVGEVKHLLVDRQAMRAAYLEVELDRDVLASAGRDVGDRNRLVHVPVERARLDDDRDDVLVDLDRAAVGGLGLADRTRPAPSSADGHRRFFGDRARGAGEQYLVLREEQLTVGKRQVSAGEVDIRKTVETKQVRETVPVRHEEVTVERRPISPDQARRMSGQVQLGEDEIRVPVMKEEVVTEKRVVPTEEIIVRTKATTEQKVVEDTVRKERVTIDRDDAARASDRRPRADAHTR